MRFARRGFSLFGLLVAAGLAGSLTTSVLPARASDDHGAAARTIVVAPRAEMRIGSQEVVISYAQGVLLLFLHSYIDGVPTRGAEIELTVDFLPNTLLEIAPGVYKSEPLTLAAGRNEIEMAYVIGEQKGTEVIPLVVTTSKAAPPRSLPKTVSSGVPGSVLAVIAVLLFAGVNFLLMRRARAG